MAGLAADRGHAQSFLMGIIPHYELELELMTVEHVVASHYVDKAFT